VRYYLVWLGLMIIVLWPVSAQAATCQLNDGQSVCLHSLQRSAKNYWEYRVQFKIAGVVQPTEIYDCLHRRKRTTSGKWQALTNNLADQPKNDLACRLFH
jgi:hypothetical protein